MDAYAEKLDTETEKPDTGRVALDAFERVTAVVVEAGRSARELTFLRVDREDLAAKGLSIVIESALRGCHGVLLVSPGDDEMPICVVNATMPLSLAFISAACP